MKKILTVLAIMMLVVGTQLSMVTQAQAQPSELEEGVKQLHNSIMQKNGGKSLNGYCAQYVSWSLYVKGITTGFEAKGNGKDVYNNWSNVSKTSGGYDVIKYPGANCLDNLIADHGNQTIYNVVVGFDYSPYGEGRKYGHVMYIYAISDGYIYYSESGTWGGKPSGTVFKKTLSEYKQMYSGHTYDGAILFTKAKPKYASSLNGWNTDYQLTGNMAEDICRVAYAQLGKNGGNLGYNNYSNAWCSVFVSDCARLAGVPESVIKNHTQAGEGSGYFDFDNSQIIDSSELKNGDLVFVHGKYDHVFICYYVDGKQLLINGNNSDKVACTAPLSKVPYWWRKNDGTYASVVCIRPNYNDKGIYIPEGTYSIRSACNENKALDVFTQSLNDKANVHLWDVGSQNSQKWKIEKNGSYYTIVNVNSGKALDVENGATTSGTNVWQYSANGTAAQNWYFEDAGNGYYYIRSACGLYLDLYGSQTANGTNIMVYNNNGGNNNQKWKLVSCTETAVSDTSTSVSSDNWGAWSAWTTDKITATENRQVETGTAYVYYHYVLQDEDGCGAYPINKATMKANGFTFYNEYYHEHVSFDELPRDTSGRLTYIVNGTRMIYDRFKNQFCNSNHNFIYSNYVYYKGTTTKYRYRDRI